MLLNINNEAKDVSKGDIIQPLIRMVHTQIMPRDMFRISMVWVLLSNKDMDPPVLPHDTDEELKLGGCLG
jgi:hypothetical protein